jgi:hypothetical protein
MTAVSILFFLKTLWDLAYLFQTRTSKHDASKTLQLTIVIVDRTVITERDGKERFKLHGCQQSYFLRNSKMAWFTVFC